MEFDFSYLINKYSTEFTVEIPSEGKYNDAGEWEAGTPTKQTLRGAIISFAEAKRFRSEGNLTEKDMRLFMLEKLADEWIGATVIYENNKYFIEQSTNNHQFTGVFFYLLKFVSVFSSNT